MNVLAIIVFLLIFGFSVSLGGEDTLVGFVQRLSRQQYLGQKLRWRNSEKVNLDNLSNDLILHLEQLWNEKLTEEPKTPVMNYLLFGTIFQRHVNISNAKSILVVFNAIKLLANEAVMNVEKSQTKVIDSLKDSSGNTKTFPRPETIDELISAYVRFLDLYFIQQYVFVKYMNTRVGVRTIVYVKATRDYNTICRQSGYSNCSNPLTASKISAGQFIYLMCVDSLLSTIIRTSSMIHLADVGRDSEFFYLKVHLFPENSTTVNEYFRASSALNLKTLNNFMFNLGYM